MLLCTVSVQKDNGKMSRQTYLGTLFEIFCLIQVSRRRQPWHLFLPATTKQVLHFQQINAKTSKEKRSRKLLSKKWKVVKQSFFLTDFLLPGWFGRCSVHQYLATKRKERCVKSNLHWDKNDFPSGGNLSTSGGEWICSSLPAAWRTIWSATGVVNIKTRSLSKRESNPRTDQLLQCWTGVKFFTSTGPAGAAGSSTSRSTTSGSTSGRGSPSTLPGSASTPAGSCPQLSLAWPSFFMVLSLLSGGKPFSAQM